MAIGDRMGQGTCTFCAFENVPLKESKNGGAAGTCPECGAQAFGKSPKAAAAAKARQAATRQTAAQPADDKGSAGKSFEAEIFGVEK